MDDLRDYRYYKEDMLHPSDMAISYIWDAFTACYFDSKTLGTWREVTKISRARGHRFIGNSVSAKKEFAKRMLSQIDHVVNNNPGIDLSVEKQYFLGILDS